MCRLQLYIVRCVLVLSLAGIVRQAAADPPQAEPPVAGAEPKWFKGNLHTHSLWSDGSDFPEMIANWYREAGYHFLALSDHNILSQGERWIAMTEVEKRGGAEALARYRKRFGDAWVETRGEGKALEARLKPLNEFRSLVEERGRFLLIQSEEITDHFEKLPIHVNASNLRDPIQPQGGKSVRETIANNLEAVKRQSQRTGQPMLAHLNHPNYGFAVTAEDMAAVTAERFFEVYNGGVNNIGDEHHPSTERMWDIANTIRVALMHAPPLMGLSTDDAHQYFGHAGSTPGRGWVWVRAKFLTPESLIAAIERGEFYASTGVTLDDLTYSRDSHELRLSIREEQGAEYTTTFIGTLEADVAGEGGKPPAPAPGKLQPVRPDERIGKVLATQRGLTPRYVLTGKELYVRAMVTSNRPPANPSYESQRQQAWTQPVGWEEHVNEHAHAAPGPAATALDK